ncbi:MAG TPA: hypothetical protein VNS46_21310 [Nocardioides sp.]|nr:hypothetical protein [Nocardioides sp.]
MSERATFTDVVDWIEGRLPAEQARRVEAEVEADPDTAASAAWVRQFLAEARRVSLEDPPAELGARLRALFDPVVNAADEDRWTTARLLYDTRDQRGPDPASPPTTAHLAFQTDLGRLVVELRSSRSGLVHLRGMLLLVRRTAVDVTLLEKGTVRRRVRSTPEGVFEVTGVDRTVDEIRLEDGDLRLRAVIGLADL